MKRLISLSKKSLSLENGSGMTREWLGIASARPFTVLVLFLMLFSFGVVNVWGEDLNSSLTYGSDVTNNDVASSDAIGTYFTATWEKTSAQADPIYYNKSSVYGVKMYAPKNSTSGNTLTISTSTSRVYITGITITGQNAQGTTALYWQGTTSNTGTSKTFTAASQTQSVAIRLKETGNSKAGQYIVKSISVDYVVVTNVTLDKNGGDSDGSIVVTYNETAGADFSAASRAGYTCTGYYTASSDGTKVLNDDGTFAGNVSGWITSSKWSKSTNTATLYAQWEAAGCSNYSFHYGTKDASDWCGTSDYCFTESTSDGNGGKFWLLEDFTMPAKPDFYVGWQGSFNEGTAKSKTLGFSTIPFDLQRTKTIGTYDGGNTQGAIGILRIRSSYGDDNKYIGFIPGGYVLRLGSGESWTSYAFTAASANYYETVWTTDIMTLTAGILGGNAYVGLKTSDSYVWNSTYSQSNAINGNMGQKSGAGDSWGSNLSSSADVGKRGKFRIWADYDTKNWNLHFVPYYQLTYNNNGGSGSMASLPATPVSCEESDANRTVTVGSCTFTAPEGKEFKEWNTQADGNGTTVATGSKVLTSDITLYAIWKNSTYNITPDFTNVTNSSLPASFTYTGSTTTALNSSFTVDETNYILPASITVTMGGSTLTQGTHYTYNSSTGAFTFDVKITGDIEITATATAKLKSIAITTQPTTRAYLVGETFSSSGAAVTATMGDGSTKTVSATWTPSGTLSAGTGQTVTATYTEAGIEKTATTTINVYSVTVQKYNEDPAEIVDAGVTVGANGRTLSQSVGSTKYVFNNWSLITASGMSISTNSLTGTPTGNVVVRANFYKPITITWLKGGLTYSTGTPTTEVSRGTLWSALTPPTDPGDATLGACATKFMGWSNNPAAEWTKEEHHTAPATLVKAAGFSSISTAITSDITFRAVFATASGSGGAAIGTTMWSEDFSSYSNPDEPSGSTNASNDNGRVVYNGGSVTYTCVDGNAATCVYENAMCGGESPELLINKHKSSPSADGAFTIGGIPVGGAATLTLTYKMNNTNISQATTSTANVTVGDRTNPSATTYVQTITISGNVSTFDLTFTNSSSSNGRIDDISVVVATQNVTYSDYVTVCCTQYDITLAGSGSVTGGTFTASPTSACEDAEVTLSATPADGYSFAGWTVTKTASPYTDITSTNVDGNTLTMPGYGVTVNATFATLTGITVKTAPTKTTYCQGEYFDPTGLVITASFSNSTTLDIPYSGNEAKFTFSPTTAAALTTGNTSVTITYGGQSTSQAITVNALRTITLTGSGTVTGGTFTSDNASACVGATISIEASAADHYSFTSWTITKTSDGSDVTGSVSIGSSSSATTSFTMPDYNVTVTAAFSENAYKTVIFKNNSAKLFDDGGSASTFDGTNHWKQKVYVGEAPVVPTALRDGHGVGGDACNDESTSFYGWTKNTWDDVIETEASVKERTAANTVYKNGATLATVAAGDAEIVYYHAVWAKGDNPTLNTTVIARWNKQEITASSAIYGVDKDDNTLNGTGGRATVTMTSNTDFNSAQTYTYQKSISANVVITIAGLDFSSYAKGGICFYSRSSVTTEWQIKTSSNGGVSYSDPTNIGEPASQEEVIYYTNIPKNTTHIQLIYPTTSGSLYFGTVRVYGINSSPSYNFTKLTSSNTEGWTNDDWDGYYMITAYYSGESTDVALRSDGIDGLLGYEAVSESATDVMTTSDIGLIFKATYSSGNGYVIQGLASGDYINTNSASKVYQIMTTSQVYLSSMSYNDILMSTGNHLQWNSDRFGKYSSSTAPTLYKILSVLTKFRTTCCEKHAITKGGATPGTVTGGTFTVDKDEACEGETVAVSITSTSSGYNFDHWTVTENTSGDAVTVTDGEFTMPDEAVTVTAVFATAHTTTVTLDKQEGKGGTNSVTATVNLDMPAADMPTRSGYEFGGYYAAPNGSGTQYYAANGSSAHVWDDGESATATLYAKWTASGYTVTLNNASATTAGTPSVSVTYGANTNLTSAITCPTKTNKVFGGYYTEADGAGTRLIDQDGNWLPSVASYTDVNRNWLYANDLMLYAKWSDVSYTNYRTTCGPEITVTGGPIYLTSYAGCEVLTTGNITVSSENWQSTVGAPKFLSFQVKNMVTGETYSHTNSTIGNAGNEVRVYNVAGNGGSYADGGYIALPTDGTNPSYDVRIAYTPSASVYNTRDHYIILVKVYDNSGTKKTLTLETVDVYGRTLPEQFVIAAKKDGKWWALPNDLASGAATAKATKAVEIVVDNETTPTAAIFAPENTLYKATGYYSGVTVANRNRSGVRFTRNGSQYLQISSTESNNNMWLSTSGGTDVQDWYLNSSTFDSYSVKIDPRGGTSGYRNKQMGMYGNNFGFYSNPTSPSEQIYFLPVESTLAEANVVEWGRNSVIVDVDANGILATKVLGRIGSTATAPITISQTQTSVKGSASKYTWTVNFGNTFDFTTQKGNKLYLDWLNSSGTVVGTSMVDIPWIISGAKTMSSDIDAVKTHWSSAEVHVLPHAVLTADAGSFDGSAVTIGQLEIYQGATVNVTTGTLTASSLMLRNGWTRAGSKEYDVARLYITPQDLEAEPAVAGASLIATNAYSDWYIDYDQYYPVSVPWTVTMSGMTYLNTTNAASAGVKMRYYDGEGRANGTNGSAAEGANWLEYSPLPTTLTPGLGYAMTARRPTGKAFSIVRLPLTIPSASWTALGEQGEVSSVHKDQVTVKAWGVDDPSKPRYAVGWNFIAQPYMSIYQGPITHSEGSGYDVEVVNIPDIQFKEYDQYPVGATGKKLLPAGGFFIQTEKDGTLTFGTTNRKASAPSYRQELQNLTTKQKAYILLKDAEAEDMMGLLISDNYTVNYDINGDVEKLMSDGTSLKTYMHYGDLNMAYVAINETLAREWIPVNVRIPADGEYTFSLHEASIADELEGVYLIDYNNGDKVTNLIDQSYTFASTAGTINGRFAINAIVGEHKTPTAIDAVSAGADLNSDKPFKFIWHDKVFILHRGVIYDSTGKKVREINK